MTMMKRVKGRGGEGKGGDRRGRERRRKMGSVAEANGADSLCLIHVHHCSHSCSAVD